MELSLMKITVLNMKEILFKINMMEKVNIFSLMENIISENIKMG